MTSIEQLDIVRKNSMEKKIEEEIGKRKWKERENKQLKKELDLGTTTNQAVQRVVDKCVEHNLL
jgi:hypothetical protein